MNAFGAAISCCCPNRSFWHVEKFFYGFLPIGMSAVMFPSALRRWTRLFTRRRGAWLAVCWPASVIVGHVILFSKYREHVDDDIELTWEPESGPLGWRIMGHFTSHDGKLVIRHDIGELAAEHGGMGRSETLVEGSRVRVALGIRSDSQDGVTYYSQVSFPDNGCAHFYMDSPREEDAATIEFIARSFRPKGWTPAWLRPLLPEMLRRDCRYRLRLPDVF